MIYLLETLYFSVFIMPILANKERPKGIWTMFASSVRDFITEDIFPSRETGTDIVSSNAKIVLYSLFALIGLAILLYTITVVGLDIDSEGNGGVDDTVSLRGVQLLEQINTVYLAAISGSIALGGTLIAQIWGRKKKIEEA